MPAVIVPEAFNIKQGVLSRKNECLRNLSGKI